MASSASTSSSAAASLGGPSTTRASSGSHTPASNSLEFSPQDRTTLRQTVDSSCPTASVALTPNHQADLNKKIDEESKKLLETKMKGQIDYWKEQIRVANDKDIPRDTLRERQKNQLKIKLKKSVTQEICAGIQPLVIDNTPDATTSGGSESFKLQARQDLAFHRFVQFSKKKGMLFMHSVGTGKTVTSLSIALNSFLWNDEEITVPPPVTPPVEDDDTEEASTSTRNVKKRKIVLVLPGAIYKNFEDELKGKIPNIEISDWHKVEYRDDTKGEFTKFELAVTPIAKVRTKYNEKTFTMIGYKYSEIAKALGDDRKDKVKHIFKNAVVIFDEAHRLFRPFRNEKGNLEIMVDKFKEEELLKDSKRFLLMTGTPYSVELKDTLKLIQMIDTANTGKGPQQTKYQDSNYQPKLLRELGYSANEEDARRERMLGISSYLLEFQLMLLNLAPRKKQDQKYPLLKNLRKSPAEEANDMIYRNYRKLQKENPDLELRFFTERFLPSFSQANLQFKHGFIGAISEEQQRKAEEEDRKFAERAILEWVAEVPLRAVEYAIAFPGLKIEGVAQAGVALLPQKFYLRQAGQKLVSGVGTGVRGVVHGTTTIVPYVAKRISMAYALKFVYIFLTRFIVGLVGPMAKTVAKSILPNFILSYVIPVYQTLISTWDSILGSLGELVQPLKEFIAANAIKLLGYINDYLPSVAENIRWIYNQFDETEPNIKLFIAAVLVLVINRERVKKLFVVILNSVKNIPPMKAWLNARVIQILSSKTEEEAARHALRPLSEEELVRATNATNANANYNRVMELLNRNNAPPVVRVGGRQKGGLRVSKQTYTNALSTLGVSDETPLEEIETKINSLRKQLQALPVNENISEASAQLNSASAIFAAKKDKTLKIVEENNQEEEEDTIDYSGLKCNVQYDILSVFNDMDLVRKYFKIARALTFSDEYEAYREVNKNSIYRKLITVENYSAVSGILLHELKEMTQNIPDQDVQSFIKEMKEFMSSRKAPVRDVLDNALEQSIDEISISEIRNNLPRNNRSNNRANNRVPPLKGGTVPIEEPTTVYESNTSFEEIKETMLDEEEEIVDSDEIDISNLPEEEFNELTRSLDVFFDKDIVSEIETEEKAKEAIEAGESEEFVAEIVADSLTRSGSINDEEASKDLEEVHIQSGGVTFKNALNKGKGAINWVVGNIGNIPLVGEDGYLRNLAIGLVQNEKRLFWAQKATSVHTVLDNYQRLIGSRGIDFQKFALESKALISNFDIEMKDIDSRYDGAKVKDHGLYYTMPSISDMRLKDVGTFFNVKDETNARGISQNRKTMVPLANGNYSGINYTKETYRYPLKEIKFIYIPYNNSQQTFGAEVMYQEKVSQLRWWNNFEKLRPKDDSDFRNSLKRCIGNYSPECEEYRPIFPLTDLPKYYPDYVIRNPDNSETVTLPSDISFTCPKFDKIFEHLILMKTGVMLTNLGLEPQPHLRRFTKYTNEKGLELSFGAGDYDMENYPSFVKPIELTQEEMDSITQKTTANIELKRLKVATHYYLPIVYSTSDEFGINLFATYLKQKGFNYITLHDNYSLSMQEREQERALKKTYKLIGSEAEREGIINDLKAMAVGKILNRETGKEEFLTKNNYRALITSLANKISDKSEPICILLHPDITEGVDAKHNPAIFLMEPPNTYQDYEQLCGRVLRTYQNGYERRPKKMVYQMACFNVNSLEEMKKQAESSTGRTASDMMDGNSPFIDEKGAPVADVLEGLDRYNLELQDYFPVPLGMSIKDRFFRAIRNRLGFTSSLQTSGELSVERKKAIKAEFDRKFNPGLVDYFSIKIKDIVGRKLDTKEKVKQELMKAPIELGSDRNWLNVTFLNIINPFFYLDAERYFTGSEDIDIAKANLDQYAAFKAMERLVKNLQQLGVSPSLEDYDPKKRDPSKPETSYEKTVRELRSAIEYINRVKEDARAAGVTLENYIQTRGLQEEYNIRIKQVEAYETYFNEFTKYSMKEQSPDIDRIRDLYRKEYDIKCFLKILGEDINPDLHEIYRELQENNVSMNENILWCQPFATHLERNKNIICRPVYSLTEGGVEIRNRDSTVFTDANGILSPEALAQAYSVFINSTAKKAPGRKAYAQFTNCQLRKIDDLRELYFMKIKAKVDLTYQPGKQVQFINVGDEDEDEMIKQCFKTSNTGADELTTIPDSSYDDFFQKILQERTVRRTGGAKKVYKTRKQVQSKKRKTRRHR